METTTSTVEEVAQLLESEHSKIEQLMQAVKSGRGEGKAGAFGELRRYLAVHEAAEEACLHPLTAPPSAEKRLAEEEAATEAIAKLETMDPESSEFGEAFATFAEDVKAHAEAEEHEELPTLVKGTSSEQLGRAYAALQLVAELVGQQDGPIPEGSFAQMHEAAAVEMNKVAGQASDQAT